MTLMINDPNPLGAELLGALIAHASSQVMHRQRRHAQVAARAREWAITAKPAADVERLRRAAAAALAKKQAADASYRAIVAYQRSLPAAHQAAVARAVQHYQNGTPWPTDLLQRARAMGDAYAKFASEPSQANRAAWKDATAAFEAAERKAAAR